MIKTMEWRGNILVLLDQKKLPNVIDFIACYDYRRVAEAIRTMEVRGAPAIGAAAAFAMVLGYKEIRMHGLSGTDVLKKLEEIKRELMATRPTAVNLAWAVNKMWNAAVNANVNKTIDAVDFLENIAIKIYEDDISNNIKIGHFGAELLPSNATILTHCNAGALATCGWGTALGVVRQGYADGKIKMVYADETRPLLQGARLTAWELEQDDIPVTLITDNMAAWTMKTKKIKAVIVGADRIALNGDVANKIGTYGVALAANALNIPFYVAAATGTFDFKMTSGISIPIEERDGDEVRTFHGQPTSVDNVPVFNPGFDVTPHELITGIITEYGVLTEPYEDMVRQLARKMRRSIDD